MFSKYFLKKSRLPIVDFSCFFLWSKKLLEHLNNIYIYIYIYIIYIYIYIYIYIIMTSYAPISSKIKLSGATKPRG